MLKRKLLALTMVACLNIGMLTGGAACTKADILSNATDVLTSLQSALPIIQQFNLQPAIIADISKAIDAATLLKNAIAAGTGNAAQYLATLIPLFQQIVSTDLVGVLDPMTRTAILAGLALADIGLNYLATHLASAPVVAKLKLSVSRADMEIVARFASEPVWGLKYKTK